MHSCDSALFHDLLNFEPMVGGGSASARVPANDRMSKRQKNGFIEPPQGLKPSLSRRSYAALEGPLFHGDARQSWLFRNLRNSC